MYLDVNKPDAQYLSTFNQMILTLVRLLDVGEIIYCSKTSLSSRDL